MRLREIKEEIVSLPAATQLLKEFQKSWIKPIRKNTNKHLPSLQTIPTKDLVNALLAEQKATEEYLLHADHITARLHQHTQDLIDAKISKIQDTKKGKHIIGRLTNDEYHAISTTVKMSTTSMAALKSYNLLCKDVGNHLRPHLITEEKKQIRPNLKKLENLHQKQQDLLTKINKQYGSLKRSFS